MKTFVPASQPYTNTSVITAGEVVNMCTPGPFNVWRCHISSENSDWQQIDNLEASEHMPAAAMFARMTEFTCHREACTAALQSQNWIWCNRWAIQPWIMGHFWGGSASVNMWEPWRRCSEICPSFALWRRTELQLAVSMLHAVATGEDFNAHTWATEVLEWFWIIVTLNNLWRW